MSRLIPEARRTLSLALPIAVGQVGQMVLGIVDSIMIGQVGTAPLAASAFVLGVFGVAYLIGIGLMLPVAVLVSSEHGAGRAKHAGEWLRHGAALGVVAAGVMVLGLVAVIPWLGSIGLDPAVSSIMVPFYTLIVVSLLPAVCFQADRQFAEAMGRPLVPMVFLSAGVLLNVGLNWLLIYGHWGLPALGLAGAGVATLITRLAMWGGLHVWLSRAERFRAAWPKRWLVRLDGAKLRELWRLGLPVSGMLMFESGAFAAAAVLMGRLGAEALAAHQIALSCAGFMFMFPLSLSMAVSMRLGRALGRGSLKTLRTIGLGALIMGCAVMSLSAVGFAVGGRWLASGFVKDAAVITLASRLLVVAAVFQLFDGCQVVASGALRGLKDVRVPTVITFVAYWVLAVPAAIWLGLGTGFGPIGVWFGLAIGMAIAAVLLVTRFIWLTRTISLDGESAQAVHGPGRDRDFR